MPKCTVCHHPQHLVINQAILSGDFTLATLRRLLPELNLALDNLPPRTEKLPKNQREITEKSAINIPLVTDKNQQYLQHKPSQKNLPKNPECAPKTAASAAPAAVVTITDASSIPSPETENHKRRRRPGNCTTRS